MEAFVIMRVTLKVHNFKMIPVNPSGGVYGAEDWSLNLTSGEASADAEHFHFMKGEPLTGLPMDNQNGYVFLVAMCLNQYLYPMGRRYLLIKHFAACICEILASTLGAVALNTLAASIKLGYWTVSHDLVKLVAEGIGTLGTLKLYYSPTMLLD